MLLIISIITYMSFDEAHTVHKHC